MKDTKIQDFRLMVKSNSNLILILSIVFFILSCDVMDSKKLSVKNNSKDTIFCILSFENHFNYWDKSPLFYSMKIKNNDTLWIENNNILYPKDENFFSDYNWKTSIGANKLNIYFFKLNTLRSNNWDSLRKNIKYDKKISQSYFELTKNNWEIIYQ